MAFEDDDDKGPSCVVDGQYARVVEPVQLYSSSCVYHEASCVNHSICPSVSGVKRGA